jgi:hypothetical protein
MANAPPPTRGDTTREHTLRSAMRLAEIILARLALPDCHEEVNISFKSNAGVITARVTTTESHRWHIPD